MQVKKTVEATMNVEVRVNKDGELETYSEWGGTSSFSGYDITEHLEQLPPGRYEVIITAKLIED